MITLIYNQNRFTYKNQKNIFRTKKNVTQKKTCSP